MCIRDRICADRERFRFPEPIEDGVYRANTRACLAIRKWIEAKKLDAFTVNFLKACPAYGIDTMPFLEACKAMTRGIGYAGEGDEMCIRDSNNGDLLRRKRRADGRDARGGI